MDETSKAAYRHLGLTGYSAIQLIASSVKVGQLNIGSAKRINKSIQLIEALAEWLSKIMWANVNNFDGFDEEEFWDHHKTICQTYYEHNLDAYRALFEDSKKPTVS